MTTALQKYDIGRVFPSQDALVTLLGQSIEAWVRAHAGDIYTIIGVGSLETTLMGEIGSASAGLQSAIDAAILSLRNNDMAGLAQAIDSLQAALGGKQGILDGDGIIALLRAQGVDLASLGEALGIQDMISAVDAISGFDGRVAGLEEALQALQAFKDALDIEILKGDIVARLLEADDDGKVSLFNYIEMRDITALGSGQPKGYTLFLRKNSEDPDAAMGTDLNKEWYCITNDEAELTIVLGTQDVINGDGVYVEYRSTGSGHAPIVNILTEGQYNDSGTAVDSVIISEDYDPTATPQPDYTIIRAKYYAGRWVAEVVPFFANQSGSRSYTVRYLPVHTGDWTSFDVSCLAGPITLAGRKPDYCGVRHIGWNTRADGTGTPYAFNQSISVPGTAFPAGETVLNLHAVYESVTKTMTVPATFSEASINSYHRDGDTGARSAAIYNSAAFNTAIAGWKELTVKVQVSFWWKTYGGAGESCHVSATRNSTTVTKTHKGPSGWTNEANAFTVTLGPRDNAEASFTLPTFSTASNEGCIIPYISGIIFE